MKGQKAVTAPKERGMGFVIIVFAGFIGGMVLLHYVAFSFDVGNILSHMPGDGWKELGRHVPKHR